jgi:hypothetical protein
MTQQNLLARLSISLLCLFACYSTTSAFTPYTRRLLNARLIVPPSTTSLSLSSFPWVQQFIPSLLPNQSSSARETTAATSLIRSFVKELNEGSLVDNLDVYFSNTAGSDAIWKDYGFDTTYISSDALKRRLLLTANNLSTVELDTNSIVSDGNAVAFRFQYANSGLRGCAFGELDPTNNKLRRIEWLAESSVKGGAVNLQILSQASKVIAFLNSNNNTSVATNSNSARENSNNQQSKTTIPEHYFNAWNKRNMDAAVALFADQVTYDDTAFSQPFVGKENLRNHLLLCADALPTTFAFQIDAAVASSSSVATKWHVENNGQRLPFTQGISFYKLDRRSGGERITDGIDFVEPSLKLGGPLLFVDAMRTKINQEPVRLVPITAWFVYMWAVFFSDNILPGANALQLEQRTWHEVFDLSVNFFLVSPLLHLPFSPTVHPMLEGVFNLLLSWAALFAGLFSDDRKDKPNLFPTILAVVGMQFLTSAVLLPYLATRTTETRSNVRLQELGSVARICESRALGPALGLVGTCSIAWFFTGRMAEFGPFEERWQSFLGLLSIDRVGSSFIVDLVIFACFQGWLVDEDLKRRGITNTKSPLALVATFVPFFGMVAYLALRPSFPSDKDIAVR